MKRNVFISVTLLFFSLHSLAQTEPQAGNWKTWFISSGKEYRLPAPSSNKDEIAQVLAIQQKINADIKQKILYWNAGAPGYRWQEMMNKLWTSDTGRYGAYANMILGTATYDAIIAAWNTKYAYNRPRPFTVDKRIKCWIPKLESPSYPCEFSVAAGVAVSVITRFYPDMADSVKKLAQQLMQARIASGTAFPSDTRAGFELGKNIAEKEMEQTKHYVNKDSWDGKIPPGPQRWRGQFAFYPTAGKNKTVVLENSSEFRPEPPPDFEKEMQELKNYKQTFNSLSNAFYWANESWFTEELYKKIFENNIHLNPPRAARIQAALNIGMYDGFVSCWDAKYAYWGIRPDQYDTTFRPVIIFTPPFPGYPSGHAAIAAVEAEILSYFFPEEKELYWRKAKQAAESRFQAGIHFRSDNEVALKLGKKVAEKIIKKVMIDGADIKN